VIQASLGGKSDSHSLNDLLVRERLLDLPALDVAQSPPLILPLCRVRVRRGGVVAVIGDTTVVLPMLATIMVRPSAPVRWADWVNLTSRFKPNLKMLSEERPVTTIQSHGAQTEDRAYGRFIPLAAAPWVFRA
jgi:hypothetical protein